MTTRSRTARVITLASSSTADGFDPHDQRLPRALLSESQDYQKNPIQARPRVTKERLWRLIHAHIRTQVQTQTWGTGVRYAIRHLQKVKTWIWVRHLRYISKNIY